ncbi:MAG: ABC transporter substrate-binding protein [Deltaproteobacteria bacterium]|nr:MAG: ABC transporter substrate-binding protein [Deltaproteobacteria bacterium]
MKRNRAIQIFFFCLSIPLFYQLLPLHGFAQEKEKEIPKRGGAYRKPLEFNPKTLDPALCADMYAVTIIQQVFDGLVQFDKDLNVIPAIADSWKISPDGLTYTFFLKKGVKFHNRREVTAKDFVYSFTRIIDPDTRSTSSDFFARILGAKEFIDKKTKTVRGLADLDPYTLKITLSEPYAAFISILAMKGAKVVPKEEVEKSEFNFGKVPVGTGPFKFVSTKEGEEIVLEANQDYFEGRPHLDKIIFKIFHGSPMEEILRSLRAGDLEDSPVPFQELAELTDSRRYTLLQKPILSLRFYGLNCQFGPLKTGKIRQAINFLVPREEVGREVLKGRANLTDRIIPLGMPGYRPGKPASGYQPLRAKQLLHEAGYPEGKGLPSIDFWSAARSEWVVKELDLVKATFSKNGIPLKVQFETQWPKFQELLSTQKAPMFMYAWYADFPDPDNFLGTLFHSRSRYNYSGYSNPEVDLLIDQAKTQREYLKRMQMYRKIEEMVLEDAPIVPMVNHLFQWAFQPYVKGIELSPLGGPYIPMRKIWLSKGN